MFLRLRVSQWMTDQVVQVRANGEKLWKNKVGPEPKNIVLRVRKRTSASGRWRLRIQYQTDLTLERRNEIAESDGRLPTIGFERLIVVPEYDLKTRLDILTKAKDLLVLTPAMDLGRI